MDIRAGSGELGSGGNVTVSSGLSSTGHGGVLLLETASASHSGNVTLRTGTSATGNSGALIMKVAQAMLEFLVVLVTRRAMDLML